MANNRAEAAYVNQHAAALHTLDELRSIIKSMPAPGGELQINWCHVGTLSQINDRLCDLLHFASVK